MPASRRQQLPLHRRPVEAGPLGEAANGDTGILEARREARETAMSVLVVICLMHGLVLWNLGLARLSQYEPLDRLAGHNFESEMGLRPGSRKKAGQVSVTAVILPLSFCSCMFAQGVPALRPT